MSDYGQVSTDIQKIYRNCVTLKPFLEEGDRVDLLPANPDRKFLCVSVLSTIAPNIELCLGVYFGVESQNIINQFNPPGGIILSWENVYFLGEAIVFTPLPKLILQHPLPQQSISFVNFSGIDQFIHIVEF
jgi:hypothetical protein